MIKPIDVCTYNHKSHEEYNVQYIMITNDDQMAIAILSCRSNTILVRGYELNKKKHKYEYVF